MLYLCTQIAQLKKNNKHIMKKIFSLISVMMLASTLFINNAKADFGYGFRAGLNVNNISFGESTFNGSNRAGFYVGPTVKLTLPVIGLGFDASALYDNRSFSYTTEKEQKESITSHTLQIPINVRYSWGLGSMANVFVFAGPQFGFNFSKDPEINSESDSYKWKKSNVSANVGVGATLFKHLEVKANYNFACSKTAEITYTDERTGKTYTDKAKFNAWQIGLGWYF